MEILGEYMKKIYITPRAITLNGHPSLEKLKDAGFKLILGSSGKRPDEQQQLKILPECVAYLAGTEPIRKNVLEAAKNLKVISRNGVGIENIDLETAENLGIQVMTTPGSNAQSVAELTIALILTSVRSIPFCSESMKKGDWKRKKGIELIGKTLGIIGCGNIGKRVINMALGLGMKVLGYDTNPDELFKPIGEFRWTSLEEIFKRSDIISLHCPPSDKALINKDSIGKMKNGVYLINTARAGLVDEKIMVDALNDGKVQIYATDVYITEPPEMNELINHEHTICTPHIGAYTTESIDRATEAAVDNILKVLK